MKFFCYSFLPALVLSNEINNNSTFFWKGTKNEDVDAKQGKIGNFSFSKKGFEVNIISEFAHPEWFWAQPITFGVSGGTFTCQEKTFWGPQTVDFGGFKRSKAPSSTIEFAYDDYKQVQIRLVNEKGSTVIHGETLYLEDTALFKSEVLKFKLSFHPTFLIFQGWREDGSPIIGNNPHKIYYDQKMDLKRRLENDASNSFFVYNHDQNGGKTTAWSPTDEDLEVFTGPAVEDFDKKGCSYEFERYAGVLKSLEINNLD